MGGQARAGCGNGGALPTVGCTPPALVSPGFKPPFPCQVPLEGGSKGRSGTGFPVELIWLGARWTEQGVLRMARGSLEGEKVAAGAGAMAWQDTTPARVGWLRGEADRDRLSLSTHQRCGWGRLSFAGLSSCPAPFPAWHTGEVKGCRERGCGDTWESQGSDGDDTSLSAGHQPGGSLAAQGCPWGSACERGPLHLQPTPGDRRWLC